MKRNFIVLFIICSILIAGMVFSADVEVASGVVDALFNAASAAADGDVLILADGGIYPNSETIPVTVPLTIKTADGYATKAKVVLAANSTGDYPWAMFNASAGIKIENVVCSGQKGLAEPYTSRFITRGDMAGNIHVDGIEVSRFTAVSMGGEIQELICENSLFNGNLSGAGGWGGTWDFQGDNISKATIRNNTFMYCTFGPYLGQGWSNLAEQTTEEIIIDHNTMYNITGAHGPTFMCSNIKDITFTNNLYVNGTFRPDEYFSNKYVDFPHNMDELPENGLISVLGPKGMWLMSVSQVQEAGTEIDMKSNNIYWTQEVLDKWAAVGVDVPPIWTNEMEAAILDKDNAYFVEQLTFVDAPATFMDAINHIADSVAAGNADPVAWEGKSPYSGWEYWTGVEANFDLREKADMDMSYNPDSESATAGTDGMPLGDTNWWTQAELDERDTEGDEIEVASGVVDALFNAASAASPFDILVLADGGVYPNSETIPVTVPLTIKTADGYATKAKVVLAANSTGDYPWAMFNASAGIKIENVVCSGQKGLAEPYTSRFITRGDMAGNIHVDGIEVSRFTAVSMGGEIQELICENSLFNGNLSGAGGWGGTWDFQGDNISKATIRNNTFMYCTFGPYLGQGWSNLAEQTTEEIIIDHNTMYNITGAHGPTFMCSNIKDITFTNNLYVNGTFRPDEYFSNKYVDFPHNMDELPENGLISVLGPKGMWLMSVSQVQEAGTEIDMKSNNIYWTQEVLDKWAAVGVDVPPIWTNEMEAAILDKDNAYFVEQLTFVDAPATFMDAINHIADSVAAGNADPVAWEGKSPYSGWEYWSGVDANFDLREKADMDMSYNTDAISYTAGTDGLPLGDLNWWPGLNPVVEEPTFKAAVFELSQNYPNPFNPTTQISYILNKNGKVNLTIYNMLGETVKTLVNESQVAGRYSYTVDASDLSSGIYFYTLSTGNQVVTKKMTLLK